MQEAVKLGTTMGRQKLGQHFLHSLAWRRKLFDTLSAKSSEIWLEIGAGHGEMTELLAASGARVFAIETDPALANQLRHRAAAWGNVEIIEADVLTVDFRKLICQRARVYGNLPYYITSPILRRLFEDADQIASIHVVIQHEVAQRIVAQPNSRDYGYLSTLCQFFSTPEIVFKIPPGAFNPPPRVISALVKMPLPGERASLHVGSERDFLEFLQQCFAQKRKTLRNNLRRSLGDARVSTALNACGLAPNVRAEQLSLRDFAGLYKAISCE